MLLGYMSCIFEILPLDGRLLEQAESLKRQIKRLDFKNDELERVGREHQQ